MTAAQPRLIVFDLDGTLVDSQHTIVESMTAAFQGSGFPVPEARAIRRVVGLSLEVAVARLLPEEAQDEALAVAERYRDAFLKVLARPDHEDPLYPGALEALAALSQPETCLGIATGKGRGGLQRVLQKHGIRDRFVTLQTADDGPSKPDPGMLHRAMAAAGIEAERCLMIGDTTFDMEMARRAGVAALGVSWGYHEVAELSTAGARRILERFDELPDAVTDLLP